MLVVMPAESHGPDHALNPGLNGHGAAGRLER